MLAPFVDSIGSVCGQDTVWARWVDCMIQKKELRIGKAALVNRETGITAAHSRGFQPTAQDIKTLQLIYQENGAVHSHDKLIFQGHSYILKSETKDSLVAFNGNKYLIVYRSRRMLIVAVCCSRKKSREAADWLKLLHQKLVQNNY